MIAIAIVIALGYLLGSIPTSVWIGKLTKNIDIREHGSKNAGATNTFRVLGWKSGTVVALVDLGKGLVGTALVAPLAFSIAQTLGLSPVELDLIYIQIIVALSAVVGHMFPLFAGFKGGKGVITAAGTLYGIEPISISLALLVFLISLFTSRYVSLSSILACFMYPIVNLILPLIWDKPTNVPLVIFGVVVATGITIKHHSNIKRLLEGNENRIKSFKPAKGRINK